MRTGASMKSPDNKTLTFVFQSIPVPHAEEFWSVSVIVPAGATAKTDLALRAVDGTSSPIKSGSFEFMGAKVKISNGDGSLPFEDFVKGVHEPGVWMLRPGHPPVPGGLTFR